MKATLTFISVDGCPDVTLEIPATPDLLAVMQQAAEGIADPWEAREAREQRLLEIITNEIGIMVDYGGKPQEVGKHTLGDFDVWYKPCEHCGYDTGKANKEDIKNCWSCGRRIYRDYSKRALKTGRAEG